jgi:hypothetical protein
LVLDAFAAWKSSPLKTRLAIIKDKVSLIK